jgi:hypothetical protein
MASISCNEPNNTALNVMVADSSKTSEHNVYGISSRQKKPPANRTDDFYGNFKYK